MRKFLAGVCALVSCFMPLDVLTNCARFRRTYTQVRRAKGYTVTEIQNRGPSRKPLVLLAVPAGIAIWAGWVGLGGMTGFGKIHPFPGFPLGMADFTLNTAITLPFSAELYGAYAFHVWTRTTDPAVRKLAKWSCLGAFALGFLAQVAFHLLESRGITIAPWLVTVLVSAVPVTTFAFGTGLWTLQRDAARRAGSAPPAFHTADLLPVLGGYRWPADRQVYRPVADLLDVLGTYSFPVPEPEVAYAECEREHALPAEPPARAARPQPAANVRSIVPAPKDGKVWEELSPDEIQALIAKHPSRRKLADALGTTPYRAQALIDQHTANS
jgi:hypothetical protein